MSSQRAWSFPQPFHSLNNIPWSVALKANIDINFFFLFFIVTDFQKLANMLLLKRRVFVLVLFSKSIFKKRQIVLFTKFEFVVIAKLRNKACVTRHFYIATFLSFGIFCTKLVYFEWCVCQCCHHLIRLSNLNFPYQEKNDGGL